MKFDMYHDECQEVVYVTQWNVENRSSNLSMLWLINNMCEGNTQTLNSTFMFLLASCTY